MLKGIQVIKCAIWLRACDFVRYNNKFHWNAAYKCSPVPIGIAMHFIYVFVHVDLNDFLMRTPVMIFML